MRNYMYLRPGNLYKDFIIEESKAEVGNKGRVKPGYDNSGTNMLKGVLAEADERQKLRWNQLTHPITHTIVQDGKPKAKAEDKLVLGERVFLIQGVDDLGSLGIKTIYFVEERKDVK